MEKAIRDAGLGLNPGSDGQLVRVPIPQLTSERRKELAKLAGKYAEGARVAVRNVRRDGMEQIKGSRRSTRSARTTPSTGTTRCRSSPTSYIEEDRRALADKEQEIRQV